MNRLQSLDCTEQFCVTLNQTEHDRSGEGDPQDHLCPSGLHSGWRGGTGASRRRSADGRRTHFCGAYWGWGFHEDGVRSALRVGRAIWGAAVKRGLRSRPTRSCLYEGTIRHRRHEVRSDAFTHGLVLAYIDLDELPRAARGPASPQGDPGWSGSVVATTTATPLSPWRRRSRRDASASPAPVPGAPIRLLTQLRSFGLCFNPVSFYYCFDATGERLEHVLAEVTNTPWGERHAYVLSAGPGSVGALDGHLPKRLHVSPFMAMEQRYRWHVGVPSKQLAVHIENQRHGTSAFDVTLLLTPKAVDGRIAAPGHRALSRGDTTGPRPDLRARPRVEAARSAGPSSSFAGNLMSPRLARTISRWVLSQIRVGSLVVVENGRRRTYGSGHPSATVEVHSAAAWPMLLSGSRGLADSYARGLWDCPDLVALIQVAARNVHLLDRVRTALAPVRAPLQHARGLIAQNTRARSRQDIAAHYDLGNEMFSTMLDSTMSYSCAVFERPGMSLEEASTAKFERICRKLELSPGDRLLEIGTGWGGFAIHAARAYGCHVTTTTISREQRDYAREQIRRAGLGDRVEVLLQDYRDLRGSYDKLVSIEMIEAVGWQHFGTFFSRCSELLAADGAMLLQAITIDDRAYHVEKASKSFINTHIFPGGCLPSLEVIARSVARRTDLHMLHLEDLAPHYVETLRRWRGNFRANGERLRDLGYDERFQRLWTMYLCYCEAGFAERRIGEVQVLLGKPQWRSETDHEARAGLSSRAALATA